MKLVEYLEQDKDKLKNSLRLAASPEKVSAVLEEEIQSILYRYNEDHGEEQERMAAAWMLQVMRMLMPLTNCVDSVETWQKTGGGAAGKGKKGLNPLSLVLLAAGIGLTAAGAFISGGLGTLIKMPVSIVLLCLGLGAMFLSGWLGGSDRMEKWRRKKAGAASASGFKSTDSADRSMYTVNLDPDRIVRILGAALQIADQNLSQARAGAEETKRLMQQSVLEEGTTQAQMILLSDLLEASYSRDGEFALDRMEDIRWYLHRMGVEIVDYTPERAEWFDIMPAPGRGTLRPALVSEGRLLRKGMAAGGTM